MLLQKLQKVSVTCVMEFFTSVCSEFVCGGYQHSTQYQQNQVILLKMCFDILQCMAVCDYFVQKNLHISLNLTLQAYGWKASNRKTKIPSISFVLVYYLAVVICTNQNTYFVRSDVSLVQPRAERMVTCSVVTIDSVQRSQRKFHSFSPPRSRAVQKTKLLKFAGILLNKTVLHTVL